MVIGRPEGKIERIHFLTPTYKPRGGVIKIFDYVTHARSLDHPATVFAPNTVDPDGPLFEIQRFRRLLHDPGVSFTTDRRLAIGPEDLVFVSIPTQYPIVVDRLYEGASPERIIHIVQGTRHVMPDWHGGYPLRLLSRPMTRIATNHVVMDSIRPFVNESSLTRVIRLGHDVGFFSYDREGQLHDPVRVGYLAWKSDIGDRVAATLDGSGFVFRSIRETASWDQLRDLYHWCDVFLAAPLPEEGFYLPALEAMSAGAIVLTPNVGGNMAFCSFGQNCIEVPYDEEEAHVRTLLSFRGGDMDRIDDVRRNARNTARQFDLAAERQAFAQLLDDLAVRIFKFEAPRSDAEHGTTARQVPKDRRADRT